MTITRKGLFVGAPSPDMTYTLNALFCTWSTVTNHIVAADVGWALTSGTATGITTEAEAMFLTSVTA